MKLQFLSHDYEAECIIEEEESLSLRERRHLNRPDPADYMSYALLERYPGGIRCRIAVVNVTEAERFFWVCCRQKTSLT